MAILAAASPAVGAFAPAKAGDANRNAGIDALRAAVTLLVVLHHTAITYGALGGWYYKEVPASGTLPNLLLILFCTTNQAWFMGFFFLLAGHYAPPALERRGAADYVRDRALRLGVPLIVFSLLLSPLTIALAQTANGYPFAGVFAYVWIHGMLEPGPLWFAEALLIFTAVLVVRRSFTGSKRVVSEAREFPSDAALLAAALVTGAAAFALRLVWPVGVNVGFLQLGYFASYVVLFWGGCAAAQGRWLEAIPEAQMRRWLRIAWLVFPIFPIVGLLASRLPWLAGKAEGGWNLQALAYAFWEPFVAWGFILALLTSFQRRFTKLGAGWRSLARRAFLIYIIHPPILVATALVWRDVTAPALVKFAITGSVACALCYFAAGLLLRVPAVARIV